MLSEPERGYDMNDDGDEDDTLYEGGHLINPASTTVTYKSSTGDILRPSQTVTGKTSDGRMLTDYLVSNGPSIPATEDPAQTRQPLQAYYRIGQSQTFTAPAITAYTGPVPASPYTTVLAVADNAVNFVYTAEADEGETPATPTQPTRPNQPGQGSDPAEEGELADTGFDARLLGVIAGLFMAVGLVIILGNSPRSSLVRSKM